MESLRKMSDGEEEIAFAAPNTEEGELNDDVDAPDATAAELEDGEVKETEPSTLEAEEEGKVRPVRSGTAARLLHAYPALGHARACVCKCAPMWMQVAEAARWRRREKCCFQLWLHHTLVPLPSPLSLSSPFA
jgi:hypothetical protein